MKITNDLAGLIPLFFQIFFHLCEQQLLFLQKSFLGFYTLSAAQIVAQQLSDTERKKLPRYPVPCFRTGRLARDIKSCRAGLGEVLIGCAVDRCLRARSLVGAYALLVDAKDEKAKSFYERYGFIPCMDAPMTLYLPLG